MSEGQFHTYIRTEPDIFRDYPKPVLIEGIVVVIDNISASQFYCYVQAHIHRDKNKSQLSAA